MGEKYEKPDRSSLKKEESWWTEELTEEQEKAFLKKIFIFYNPLCWPFMLLYLYVAWILKSIHKACLNIIDKRVRWYWKASLVVLLLLKISYIIFPIDGLPDVIPYYGFLDDISLANVILLLVHAINRVSDKSIKDFEKEGLLPGKS